MTDPTKTVMDELARTSGGVGVDRLAALFVKREPEAAKAMSMSEIRKLANEVLKIKPDKLSQTDTSIPCRKIRGGGARQSSERGLAN